MKTFRNPATVHPPLAAYSHQVEIRGPARTLVLSGQVGTRPDGSVPENPIDQLKVAMDNVIHNLQSANMRVDDLVKLTFYVVGEMDSYARREVLSSILGHHAPCSTLVYVAALASPALRVEIDAWASRED
jgi:2-iminobutanoate/2-iminopropanoate deaminase